MAARSPKTVAALLAALVAALAAVVWLGTERLVSALGGGSAFAPEDAAWLLSERARALVDAAYADLGEDAVVQDHWVHLLSFGQRGAGDSENRSFVNPDWLSWWSPLQRLRAGVLLDAGGVTVPSRADDQYLSRLLRLARALPGRHRLHLAALDQRYDPDGRPRPDRSVYAVDNDYVWSIARAHPERVKPVVSVHPYRPHARSELTRWAGRGVDAVAWIPALQGIDPADERLLPYYEALAENGMTLYTHTGAATGFGTGNPAYGNPMRYRAALDAGVNVVMIHCAATGTYPDPEDGGRATGTELFLRLLRKPEYADRLRGAIAGVAVRDRAEGALTALLQHPELFDRLVYASGYPLPAVDAAIDTRALAEQGFVTDEQAGALREIHAVNPLLFDFVLKRTLRLPHTDLGLPPAVFGGGQAAVTPE